MYHIVKKNIYNRFFGEWMWERNILWLFSFLCMLDALMVSGDNYQDFLRDGAFHAGLLIGISGYLSELRYNFFKNLRNDELDDEAEK